MRPRVSVCVIARDEERHLVGCLGPIKSLVDEMIVLDTGSTDRTREVAVELGAEVHDFVWNDNFAAARNACLGHATGEWIVWLDADERIDAQNRQRLVQLLDGLGDLPVDACLVRVFSEDAAGAGSGCWDTQPRIVRRAAGVRWQHRVHEELVAVDPRARLATRATELVIQHVGGRDATRRRRKLHRDLRLAQLEHSENPDDSRNLFYFGWDHLKAGHCSQSLRLLQQSMVGAPPSRKLFALLAEVAAQMGRRNEALEFCDHGLCEFPDDPELLYRRGHLLAELGDLAAAHETLVKLVNLGSQSYMELGVEDGLQTEKGRCLLGMICHQQDRWAEAELHYRTAIRHRPRSAQAWLGLGQVYLDVGHTEGARHAAAELQQCPAGSELAPALQTYLPHLPVSGVPGPIAHRPM